MNPNRTRRRAVRPADGLALFAATAPGQTDVRARRGDLALIVTAYRDPVTTAITSTEIDIAEVTGTTRDGQITTVRPALTNARTGLSGWHGLTEVYLLPRTRIGVAAALFAARTHIRNGQPVPYPDLDTACAALRPRLISVENHGAPPLPPTREAHAGNTGEADLNRPPAPGWHCRHNVICPAITPERTLTEAATLILAELITISDGGPGAVLPARLRFAAEVYPRANVVCIQVFGLRDAELASPDQRPEDAPSPTDIAGIVRAVADAASPCDPEPGKKRFEVRVFLPSEADQRQLSGFIGTVTTDSRPHLPTGA
ncbi:hypothetical protein M8C13_05415 [Crossiella sp. SN42]|uniref:hypothetical protein n=1 Tax=Crossiella sp. SN42 TaxID=2944808 RepID=UPI00207C725F|nr:hypothetical protein [Crossiella sp. SN42]MCO1575197.1 hypothetical protein [Crossiella sp. SN42]